VRAALRAARAGSTFAPTGATGTVSFDAVGPSSAGQSATAVASTSWSHTCTGTNRLLVVGVAVGDTSGTGTIGSVTYNNVVMTSVAKVFTNNTAAAGFVEMFQLVAPATGANTVAVTASTTMNALSAGSVSFTGVHQTTPVGSPVTAFGNSSTPAATVTGTTAGNMVVDAACAGIDFTADTQTMRWRRNTNTDTGAGNGTQSTAAAGGSVTMSHTISNDWWGVVAVEVKAASGAGGGIVLNGTTYFSEDFTNGNLLGFEQIHNVRNNFGDLPPSSYVANTYHVQVVDIGGAHGNVVRLEIRDGDSFDGGSTERTELMWPYPECASAEGDVRWYQYDVRYGDPTWPTATTFDGNYWETNWQQHHAGDTGAPVILCDSWNDNSVGLIQAGLAGQPKFPLFTIVPGQWERIVWNIKHSINPAVGYIQVWKNDVVVLAKTFCQTMLDAENYTKFGIYRNAIYTNTQVIMYDNIKMTNSAIVP